jgi:2-methylisocitrate lyase-like PEP mutase family enzyme
MSTQQERLEQFRTLHGKGRLLVLPNAWDAASARMVQELGSEAVATSSAAVAWCHGYADGETMPTDVVLAAVREVMRVVAVPMSVDSEAGYSSGPAQVAAHVMRLIELGAVGINLEDGKGEPDLLCRKIVAIKEAARSKGADIFINARCDVYLQNLVPDEDKLAEMIRRGRLYAEAGADGLFAPAMHDLGEIAEVIAAIDLPLNILAMRVVPPIAELKSAGVRRVSVGAITGRAAYGAALKGVSALLKDGTYDTLLATSGDCPNFNTLFSP